MREKNAAWVETGELHFDLRSPRFHHSGLKPDTDDEDAAKYLWQSRNVQELLASILRGGYFTHRPLLTAREEGRTVVLDGNRRLAAVRIALGGDHGRGPTPERAQGARSEELRSLPAVMTTREEAWRPILYEHTRGSAGWTSDARSMLVREVLDGGVSLADVSAQMDDRHGVMARLAQHSRIMEQVQAAGTLDREDPGHNYSSVWLLQAIGHQGIREFLGLPRNQRETGDIPPDRMERAVELLDWLFGNSRSGAEPAVRRDGDIGKLDRVLQDEDSLAELRRSHDLERALEAGRAPENTALDALYRAREDVRKALSALSALSTQGAGSGEIMNTARGVALDAVRICELQLPEVPGGGESTEKSREKGREEREKIG